MFEGSSLKYGLTIDASTCLVRSKTPPSFGSFSRCAEGTSRKGRTDEFFGPTPRSGLLGTALQPRHSFRESECEQWQLLEPVEQAHHLACRHPEAGEDEVTAGQTALTIREFKTLEARLERSGCTQGGKRRHLDQPIGMRISGAVVICSIVASNDRQSGFSPGIARNVSASCSCSSRNERPSRSRA